MLDDRPGSPSPTPLGPSENHDWKYLEYLSFTTKKTVDKTYIDLLMFNDQSLLVYSRHIPPKRAAKAAFLAGEHADHGGYSVPWGPLCPPHGPSAFLAFPTETGVTCQRAPGPTPALQLRPEDKMGQHPGSNFSHTI